MRKTIIAAFMAISFFVHSSAMPMWGQTDHANVAKVKAEAQKRVASQKRTKVKLFSDATYVGVVSDAGETSLTITDKSGSRHTAQYNEVKSIGGIGGLGTGAKIGLGIGIGAGVVLAVLAAIVHSND
jgi:hypothetical protein